ncbi:uncharacterized protein LOC135131139 isoform X1 [Zophobas morio]|uniref:uncharacterized protein LOC135131139 isoform X1 n=1 Tax=Zophobas morio TaxID=2755281 RepID=UPI0030833581
MESPPTCNACHKTFSSVSTKNRHMKTMHNIMIEEKKSKHIRCPLCPIEQETLVNQEMLINHLTEIHKVSIKEFDMSFRNMEEFQLWRSKENREVDYACARSKKTSNGDQLIYYNCNRSDSYGFHSRCTKRGMKTGGTIRISGICPSRIVVRICGNGMVNVKFVETHVGHQNELRTKRLTKEDQMILVEQLHAGVTNERILQDARKINENQLERKNLITRGDLEYLIRKFNVNKRRNADDMVATALKIEEWNKDGKNYAFLFKRKGESHPDLLDTDFAVGYMNEIMEKKLKDFKRIICIDGTHGTNRMNYELTTILIRDEDNMGFPVAFLVSNRLDTLIQKVFFAALKEKLGHIIEAEYVMSDDDPK